MIKEMTDLSEQKEQQQTSAAQEETDNKQSGAGQETDTAQCESVPEPQLEQGDETAGLREEIKKLQTELEKQKDLDMRVRAEYDNFRKRTSREMGEIAVRAKAEAIAEILPIADNIDRALSVQEGSEADIRKGVEMIHTQIENVFQKLGIEVINEENVEFDPHLHNAVMHVEDESAKANMVIQVLQKGYKIGSRVLRYAMVKVAN